MTSVMIDLVKSNLSLLDINACGENLFLNSERVLRIAPMLCRGCEDYHIRAVLHRTARFQKGINVDRPQIVSALKPLLQERSGRIVKLLIAGAADTGILSTCAHAAAAIGGDVIENIHFTVADRCATPLALCAAYAQEYNLKLRTQVLDFLRDDLVGEFDIAVLHSVLRFLAPSAQRLLLIKLKRRMKPGGSILISHKFIDSYYHGDENIKRGVADDTVLEHIDQGRIRTVKSIAEIEALLLRSRDDRDIRLGELRSDEELRSIITDAGLNIVRLQHVSRDIQVTPTNKMKTYRVIVQIR